MLECVNVLVDDRNLNQIIVIMKKYIFFIALLSITVFCFTSCKNRPSTAEATDTTSVSSVMDESCPDGWYQYTSDESTEEVLIEGLKVKQPKSNGEISEAEYTHEPIVKLSEKEAMDAFDELVSGSYENIKERRYEQVVPDGDAPASHTIWIIWY